ncbi:NAD(P)H-dependent oxidoreductase [Saccharopolyspora shandongensis]|uniref:NAD(P)H-dependent oxidoreductase n=1 Tax=Saccharopolyspora shandongensis TaxID=418495 RepID=UPI0033C9E717
MRQAVTKAARGHEVQGRQGRLHGPVEHRRDRCGDATDGLIVITPVFSVSYSGLFKSFFNALEKDGHAVVPTAHTSPVVRALPAVRC